MPIPLEKKAQKKGASIGSCGSVKNWRCAQSQVDIAAMGEKPGKVKNPKENLITEKKKDFRKTRGNGMEGRGSPVGDACFRKQFEGLQQR